MKSLRYQNNFKFCFSIFLFILSLSLIRCTKEEKPLPVPSEDSIFLFIDELMHSWYYWYEEVPEIDVLQFDEPQDLLDTLKYTQLDKWSFVDKASTINSLFNEGESFGFGFMVRFDPEGDLRVLYVYKNSKAYEAGIKKGFRIESINDVPSKQIHDFDFFFDDVPASYRFIFLDENSDTLRVTIVKETVTQNAVFHKDILDVNGTRTGYLVYNSFLEYTQEELEEAFMYFHTQTIDELIIDLRYNQGGHIDLARSMAEMILPVNTVDKPLFSYEHNDIVASIQDTTLLIKSNPLNLNLNRVFFITSRFSASASELVINCLEPYMEVILIGSPTHGKPMGMYGFSFNEWYVFPVTVKLVNADGYGDFFEGLPVDKSTSEGLDKDWADLTDPSLSQALYYIGNGSFDEKQAVDLIEPSKHILSPKSPLNRSILIVDQPKP